MLKIIEAKKELPPHWKLRLPDFDSHLEFIQEQDDEEERLQAYEEE